MLPGKNSTLLPEKDPTDGRIKEYRARFNFTQEELAGKVNVRRETIVFLERNRYNPSLRLAFDLARVFLQGLKIFLFRMRIDHGEGWPIAARISAPMSCLVSG